MTKYGLTKTRILKLISEGNDNLSDLGRLLGLAPSTVSKHLSELEAAGAISLKREDHFRKWKHYEVLDGGNIISYGKTKEYQRILNRTSGIVLSVLLVAVVVALIYTFGIFNTGSKQAMSIPISLTDPPHVPAGTQSLYVNYSSFEVLVNNSGAKAWVPVNASGRINLMSIINVSDIIGALNMRASEAISEVRFNISSASITIDNVTYPVTIADSAVNTTLPTYARLNESSVLMIDFSPVVITDHDNGTYRFILLPFLNAAFGMNPGSGSLLHHYNKGTYAMPQVGWYMIKNNPFYRAINVSVASSNISTNVSASGNSTLLSITVKNQGNTNATVYGVVIEGAGTLNLGRGHWNGSDWGNAYNESGPEVVINASTIYNDMYGVPSNGSGNIMIKLRHPISTVVITDMIHGPGAMGMFIHPQLPLCIDFTVENNGTLVEVPLMDALAVHPDGIGYRVGAGSAATFLYGARSGHNGSTLDRLAGNRYNILVFTSDGIASLNESGNVP